MHIVTTSNSQLNCSGAYNIPHGSLTFLNLHKVLSKVSNTLHVYLPLNKTVIDLLLNKLTEW